MLSTILWWLALLFLVESQDLDFDLLPVQVPWPPRVSPQFRDWSHHSDHPVFSALYAHLNISHRPSSLWAVYGGWTSEAHISIPTNDYPAFNYLEPRTFKDIWISTTEGQTWVDVTNLVSRLYLHIYCGEMDFNGGQFNSFQRGWIPSWDPDIFLENPQRIKYAAWQLLVTQPFEARDTKYCLYQNLKIYYTLEKKESVIGGPIAHGGVNSRGLPWYELDPSQFFRTAVISGTHYNNSLLGGRDIQYILGGSLIQPDYGGYDLKDLWASSDWGQTWKPMMYRHSWDVGTGRISLAVDKSGVMAVNVDRGNLQYGSDLYISLNGGHGLWGVCRYKAPYGQRHAGLLFFDRQGYLYVTAGYLENRERQDVWRSQISFNDLEAVREKCLVDSSSRKIGLSDWSLAKKTNLRLQPVLGVPLVQEYRVSMIPYWQIGLILLSLITTLSYVMYNRWCQKNAPPHPKKK